MKPDELFTFLDRPPPSQPVAIPHGPEIEALRQRAGVLAIKAKAANTRLAYRKAWKHYCAWSLSLGLEPLAGDPHAIGLYFAACAHLRPSTVRQRAAAIQLAHQLAGVPLDLKHHLAASILQGIEREQGRRPRRQATPLLPGPLKLVLRAAGDGPLAIRDRALVLLGFGGALRRSEIAALDRDDATPTERGVKLLIRWSKADQQGDGEEIAIVAALDPDLCARRALEAWLRVRGNDPGPLFYRGHRGGRFNTTRLTPAGVNLILKRLIARAGGDPTHHSGHSLRAGLATEAALRGAHLHQIMKQTRHRSADAARRYLREAELWQNNITELVLAKPDPQPSSVS